MKKLCFPPCNLHWANKSGYSTSNFLRTWLGTLSAKHVNISSLSKTNKICLYKINPQLKIGEAIPSPLLITTTAACDSLKSTALLSDFQKA